LSKASVQTALLFVEHPSEQDNRRPKLIGHTAGRDAGEDSDGLLEKFSPRPQLTLCV
jgi:hypothetical protein